MEFANQLRNLRDEANISREDLATQTGITYAALSKYETGEREPDFNTLCKIARHFDVSTDYLLGISKVKTPEDILKGLPPEARQAAELFIEFLHDKFKGQKLK